MVEARAFWITGYISPEGFGCQLTLRADSRSELLEYYLLSEICGVYQRHYDLGEIRTGSYRADVAGENRTARNQGTRNALENFPGLYY